MSWVLNIVSNYLRFLVGMVLVFFLTPFILAHLGMDLFGLWSLIFAVVGMFGLLDLGFATAAVKYVAEHAGRQDHEGRNQILSTLLVIYSGLGMLCLLLVVLLAKGTGGWFELTTTQRDQFSLALWMLGAAVALGFPLSLFKAALVGSGRQALVNGIELGTSLVNAAAVVLVLDAGYGLPGLAAVTAVTMLGANLLLIPFAYRLLPRFSLSPSGFAPGRVGELLHFSIYFFIANVAVLVILRIDPVVIKMFLSLEAVAIYAVAGKVSEYSYLLNKQFSNALMPLVSQSSGAGDQATVQRVLVDGSRFLLAIALPFGSLLFFYAPEIIQLWMGKEFAESANLLRLLLGAVLGTALQLNAANVLGMTGRHKFVAFAMGGSAVLNLGLSLLLIQIWDLPGVALATLIATLSTEVLLVVPRACREHGIRLYDFVRRALWPTLPALVPMLGLAFLLGHWQAPDAFLWIFLQGGLCALVYFLTFFLTGLTEAERRLIGDKLRRRTSHPSSTP